MMKTWRALVLTSVVLVTSSVAFAGINARITGQVKDSSGKAIVNATITITSPDVTNYKKIVTPDKHGRYQVLILDATQKYVFHVAAPGYQAVEESVKVPAGSMSNVFNFTLKTIEEVHQEVQKKALEQPGFKEFRAGQDLLKAGDKAGARKKFEEAVAAKPDMIEGWTALGTLDYEAGNYKEALKDARKCLDLDDEAVNCLATAANAAKQLGDTKAQREYLARYRKLNPDDPATLFDEAAQFLNKMDDQHAKPLLEKCLKADPNYGPCVFQYGMLLLRAGDMAGAKKLMLHYLKVAPNGKEAATAKETLKYL
ncbi:MAG: tetratricopeptide repeat protein [Acidobacteria bacterium]|nr:tetratricopeptide repeat protein [Acidobacteriota bacterium]